MQRSGEGEEVKRGLIWVEKLGVGRNDAWLKPPGEMENHTDGRPERRNSF